MSRGVSSADYNPPAPWRSFYISLKEPGRGGRETERTIGGLTDAELQWLARCVIAESHQRADAKMERRMIAMQTGKVRV